MREEALLRRFEQLASRAGGTGGAAIDEDHWRGGNVSVDALFYVLLLMPVPENEASTPFEL